MCGIAGILTRAPEASGEGRALTAMRCALQHRGPDDQGSWTSPGGQAAFAHTRLAILDLTSAGHQPMSTADGRFTITYNGEIYNFRELRHDLEARGARFATESDTEVILKAFELDGPACLPRLRGMFALALWDERERSCLFARDRFGIKPLYVHHSPQRLAFASEVRALIASGLVAPEIDPAALLGYFMTGTVPEPGSLLRGVTRVEAGSYAIWRDGELTSTRYWDFTFAAQSRSDDPVEDTRRALIDSVAHHFVSDTPVGIFLSGGVDSTALVALARQAGRRDLRTYSLAFPGEPEDESVTARQTADLFGTTHVEFTIDAAAGRQMLHGFLDAFDQPSIDGLNVYAVSKLAREHGIKVVLSGIGSDELFGGYPSFDQVPRLHAWNRRLAMVGPARVMIGRQLNRSSDPRRRRLGEALTQSPQLSHMYQCFRGVFTQAEARQLVEHYTGETAPALPDAAVPADPTARDTVSRLELTRYMRNQPLRDADTMSMAWGLELRVPFLDNAVADTVTSIPADVRLQPGKRLLLQAVPELPSWVTSQPKRGFFFPFRRWFDQEWHDMFAHIERDSPVPTATWYRTMSVFVFERWLEKLKAQPT